MPSTRAVVITALISAACTAKISDPNPEVGLDATTGTGGGVSVGGSSAGSSGASCGMVDPGPSYIRRVTRQEYDNTLHDLLGETGDPAGTFPLEEKGLGFDNNAASLSVSPVLAEQYLAVAEKVATHVVANGLSRVVPCDPAALGIDACAQQFINSFGQRAYRRPLDADDRATLTAAFNAGKVTDFATGVRLVIETILQAPRFLYRVEFGRPPTPSGAAVQVSVDGTMQTVPVVRLDSWETASRLAYQLWNSMPDDALFAAAQAGQLETAEQVAAQAKRMLADDKARAMVGHFHDQWLRVGEIDAVVKDTILFPEFSASIAGLMQEEARRFLDDAVWQGPGTLQSLLTAPSTFVNATLASYYGISGVSGDAFVKVALNPAERGGFLTQGGLLSLLAKPNQTGPVQRGKFVREQLLCNEMPPPPPGVEIKAPELSATLSTRQRFSQHATSTACAGCHHLMDPIGLGFEGFDAGGRARATENGVAVDTSGDVLDSDIAGAFQGPLELEARLSKSNQVRDCMTQKWFRYAYGRAETAADACTLQRLQRGFASGGGKIQDLLLALTTTDAFLYRRALPPAGGEP